MAQFTYQPCWRLPDLAQRNVSEHGNNSHRRRNDHGGRHAL